MSEPWLLYTKTFVMNRTVRPSSKMQPCLSVTKFAASRVWWRCHRTAFKAVSKVSPSLVENVVDNLLDKFVGKLEPFFTEWDDGGRQASKLLSEKQ